MKITTLSNKNRERQEGLSDWDILYGEGVVSRSYLPTYLPTLHNIIVLLAFVQIGKKGYRSAPCDLMCFPGSALVRWIGSCYLRSLISAPERQIRAD